MKKALIAYYSRPEENYVSGSLVFLKEGNTKVVAELISRHIEADLFEIEQLKPYSRHYNECTDQAQSDLRRGARPELKVYPDSLDEYEDIYLGFPNYWSTMPMAVFTFLEKCDLRGKRIHPFITHEGSGFGRALEDLKKECPHSIIGEGLAIHGSKASQAEPQIISWLEGGR